MSWFCLAGFVLLGCPGFVLVSILDVLDLSVLLDLSGSKVTIVRIRDAVMSQKIDVKMQSPLHEDNRRTHALFDRYETSADPW